MSQSSMATTPSKKKKELFHRASRFVIVYSTPQGEDGAQQQQRDEKNIAAFSMFRFDFEEDEEVLYWQVFLELLLYSKYFTMLLAMKCRLLKASDVWGLGDY